MVFRIGFCSSFLALFVLYLTNPVDAAVAFGVANVNVDHPGQCYDEATQSAHDPEESWTTSHCTRTTCMRDSRNPLRLLIQVASCGVAQVDEPCKLVEDLTATYPDCCPIAECPKDLSTTE